MPIVEVLLGERVRQRLAEMARNGACRAGPKLGTLPQLGRVIRPGLEVETAAELFRPGPDG